MKGCLHDPKTRISQHDYTEVQKFRHELTLHARLVSEGHTQECATLQLWEPSHEGKCTCKALKGEG